VSKRRIELSFENIRDVAEVVADTLRGKPHLVADEDEMVFVIARTYKHHFAAELRIRFFSSCVVLLHFVLFFSVIPLKLVHYLEHRYRGCSVRIANMS